MGVHVFPRFSVFHRFPEAAATYQTLGFFGSTSTSAMRPVVRLGPMLRNARPLKTSAVSRSPLPWAIIVAVASPTAAAPVQIRCIDPPSSASSFQLPASSFQLPAECLFDSRNYDRNRQMLHRVPVRLVGLVRLVMLAQQVLAVVVAVGGTNDGVDVTAAGHAG